MAALLGVSSSGVEGAVPAFDLGAGVWELPRSRFLLPAPVFLLPPAIARM